MLSISLSFRFFSKHAFLCLTQKSLTAVNFLQSISGFIHYCHSNHINRKSTTNTLNLNVKSNFYPFSVKKNPQKTKPTTKNKSVLQDTVLRKKTLHLGKYMGACFNLIKIPFLLCTL